MQRPLLNFGLIDYSPRPAPTLHFRAVGQSGLLYEEKIPAGVGSVEVKTTNPFFRWRLDGAHLFVGHGARSIPWATPGQYQMTWFSSLPGIGAPAVQSGRLLDKKQLVFEAEHALEGVTAKESFDAGFESRWERRNEASCKSALGRPAGGAVVATGNCHNERDMGDGPRPGQLLVSRQTRFSQGLMAVRIKALDNDGFGIRYAMNPSGAHYHLELDAQRAHLKVFRVEKATHVLLAQVKGFKPPLERWFTLAVSRRGDVHKVFIDSHEVLEVRDGAETAKHHARVDPACIVHEQALEMLGVSKY